MIKRQLGEDSVGPLGRVVCSFIFHPFFFHKQFADNNDNHLLLGILILLPHSMHLLFKWWTVEVEMVCFWYDNAVALGSFICSVKALQLHELMNGPRGLKFLPPRWHRNATHPPHHHTFGSHWKPNSFGGSGFSSSVPLGLPWGVGNWKQCRNQSSCNQHDIGCLRIQPKRQYSNIAH